MKLVAYLRDIWTRLFERSGQPTLCLPTGVDPDWLAWRENLCVTPAGAQPPEDLDEVSLKLAKAL